MPILNSKRTDFDTTKKILTVEGIMNILNVNVKYHGIVEMFYHLKVREADSCKNCIRANFFAFLTHITK